MFAKEREEIREKADNNMKYDFVLRGDDISKMRDNQLKDLKEICISLATKKANMKVEDGSVEEAYKHQIVKYQNLFIGLDKEITKRIWAYRFRRDTEPSLAEFYGTKIEREEAFESLWNDDDEKGQKVVK